MSDANALLIILPAIFVVAVLYSSVGHGGASGYLAVFTLAGAAVAELVPMILVLNILVASVSFWQYYRQGEFSWKLLAPFVVTSIPAAFLGGLLTVPKEVFSLVLAAALLLSAVRLLMTLRRVENVEEPSPRALWLAGLPIGAALGFVSGMIGIGGGVFLSPLLIFLRWSGMKRTSAVAAAFIVLNSISGLAGKLSTQSLQPAALLPFAFAALLGGYLGSRTAAVKLQPRMLRGVLAAVLLVAGGKLLLPFLQ